MHTRTHPHTHTHPTSSTHKHAHTQSLAHPPVYPAVGCLAIRGCTSFAIHSHHHHHHHHHHHVNTNKFTHALQLVKSRASQHALTSLRSVGSLRASSHPHTSAYPPTLIHTHTFTPTHSLARPPVYPGDGCLAIRGCTSFTIHSRLHHL